MTKKPKILVIIPARGGSKRIPRKNVRLIAGKQMLLWPLQELLNFFAPEEIVVSTEDDEIKSLARDLGINSDYSRPQHLADDYVGTSDVARDALSWFEKKHYEVDYVVIVYPTAVNLDIADVKSALVQMSEEQQFDKLMTVTRFRHPIERAILIDNNKIITMLNPQYKMTRSQDLQEKYHDAGQFYIYKKSALYNEGGAELKCTALILDSIKSVDIDTNEDIEMAEALIKNRS